MNHDYDDMFYVRKWPWLVYGLSFRRVSPLVVARFRLWIKESLWGEYGLLHAQVPGACEVQEAGTRKLGDAPRRDTAAF